MILSIRFLTSVADVNTYQNIAQAEIFAGDDQNLYFQLTDMAVDRAEQGFRPAGRRYCPPTGTTMVVTLNNVDDAQVITRAGVQAFPTLDASIWYVPILNSDALKGSVVISIALTLPGGKKLGFTTQKGCLLRVR